MRNLFLCVLLSTLALAATGCGKSKSSTNPDAAEAAARAGDQALANADLAGANAHYTCSRPIPRWTRSSP